MAAQWDNSTAVMRECTRAVHLATSKVATKADPTAAAMVVLTARCLAELWVALKAVHLVSLTADWKGWLLADYLALQRAVLMKQFKCSKIMRINRL